MKVIFKRLIPHLGALFLIAFVPAIGAQNLSLTLAVNPPRPGVISTASRDSLVLTVSSGSRVSFARSRGRDYRLQASGGFFWTQVQEIPGNVDAVTLTPTLVDDGSIEVRVEVARKNADRQQSYSSTVQAAPGEWIQLFGRTQEQRRDSRVYGTQNTSQDTLFMRVEP